MQNLYILCRKDRSQCDLYHSKIKLLDSNVRDIVGNVAVVMGAYFTLIGCPYITSVELVDVSDMLYIGGSLYILAH